MKQPSFLDLEEQFRGPGAAVALLPVPFDATSSWKKGADRGPAAIIEASRYLELFDIETRSEPYRHGIRTLAPVDEASSDGMVATVQARVAEILEAGQLPVVLGGEHSVSVGAMQAAAACFPQLSILQIDAHGDTRDSYEGSPLNHACVMARARELAPIVQVGIRSVDASEVEALNERRVFWAHDLHGSDAWMDEATALLGPEVYVTIDLDAFDPSLMPATGTPEPGGLDWRQVTELLGRVAASRRVIGFDVVELLPQDGHHGCDFLAAKLVYRFLAMILAADSYKSSM